MNAQLTIEGIVDSIIFNNPDNGYTVFSMQYPTDDEEDAELICVGYIHALNEGENIRATGYFAVHPSYGRQFQVQLYKKEAPTTEQGIEKYLASGVIKGIGAKLAKRIVDEFGCETLKVMETAPEKLSKIKGISLEKALSYGEIFNEQRELRIAMLALQNYGITPMYAMKIHKKYKENTLAVVESNPYELASDIFGIGFKTADNIAFKVGIPKDSPHRITSGINYVLNTAATSGHVYLPSHELIKKAEELLLVPCELIENVMMKMQLDRRLMMENAADGKIVYLHSYYYAESYVAKKLNELSMVDRSSGTDYDSEIKETEKETNIVLAKEQKAAVKEAMTSGVLILTGGPGTGKTTTINSIIHLLKKRGLEIQLAAPTGRAAKRLTEATGIEAQTIHRLLGIEFMSEDSKRQRFDKDEDNPLETDVLIIDETSMVDILLMCSLLKAVPYGVRLILAGDADQLPSVGPGNVLKDIIKSGCLKVVRLKEIFRQAEKSAIVMNAHRINSGEYPVLNEKNSDFFFIKKYNPDDLIKTIVQLVSARLPKFKACDSLKDIQVLTPMRKSPLGVVALNSVLQQALNPPHETKLEKEFRSVVFREGDKVMQIKNNYNMVWKVYDGKKQTDEGLGVFNGDEGIILSIDDNNEYITVMFDDNKIISYDYSQLDELELSYAVTIHKSQGSEYRIVVIPLYDGPDMLFSRNLLYTAVTRARELAVIVGVPQTLNKMVDNNREVNRYTALDGKIRKMYKFFDTNLEG